MLVILIDSDIKIKIVELLKSKDDKKEQMEKSIRRI